jgi:(heptosyl)LPS beta-1,4-glucosyltransferase
VLSVAIIARDEERHIAEAIRSAQPVADEVLVLVDPRTVDRTREIAAAEGALIYEEPFRSHAGQRNRALRYCHQPWVLFLDADERLTEELAGELQGLELGIGDRAQLAGFWIPRYNIYWGRRLRGGGWYPDQQLRLLRRTAAHFDERRLIHEYAELDGPSGTLRGHLLHINIESLAELRQKQYFYAVKEAETLHQQGQRARRRNLVLQPLREVKRRFWTWKGYRDGALGLFLALTMGYYEWVKYVKLYALQRSLETKATPAL